MFIILYYSFDTIQKLCYIVNDVIFIKNYAKVKHFKYRNFIFYQAPVLP